MTSLFETLSRDLVDPLRVRLRELCKYPIDHARFLNTLSLLEYIGSRKIMASRIAPQYSNERLKHFAEESRHALFFKRTAERMAGTELGYGPEETFAAPRARMYMNRLDAYITGTLGEGASPQLPYLYMSLIVELRAVCFYRAYQAILTELGQKLSLKGLLAEEEVHLIEMQHNLELLDPGRQKNVERFCAFEARRFRMLWSGIEAGVNR